MRTHGQQWHQLPGHLCRRFRLLSGGHSGEPSRWLAASRPWLLGLTLLTLLPTPARSQAPEDGPEDFGRWQATPSHCLLQRSSAQASSPPPRNCRSVRLDQLLPGLLSLRFSEASPGGRLNSPQLTLAGVLLPGSRAMGCREGRCQPRWPLLLQVSALADRGLGPQPGLSQLPLARLAKGSCQLDSRGARCQAEDSEGLRWTVDVRW